VIEAASGGGLQVSITFGAATSPDEQHPISSTGSGSREGLGVTVGLGVGDGLALVNPHPHNASRIKS
jgi:hypothetical protein